MPTENNTSHPQSDVKRWQLKGFIPSVEGESKAVFRPVVVLADDLNRVAAERNALQLRLNAADQRIDELVELLRDFRAAVQGELSMLRLTGPSNAATTLATVLFNHDCAAFKPAEEERDQGIPGTSFQRLNMLDNHGE